MSLFTIVIIGIGLSMDALAAAIAHSASAGKGRGWYALVIASFFGIFQAAMPVIGFLAGLGFKSFITGIDHWIAFILLFLVGMHMIYEAFKKSEIIDEEASLKIKTLFFLAVATSIDALVVGVSFSFLEISIIKAALIIGVVTFVISLAGVIAGKTLKNLFGRKVEIIGGLILIGIGVKILLGHL